MCTRLRKGAYICNTALTKTVFLIQRAKYVVTISLYIDTMYFYVAYKESFFCGDGVFGFCKISRRKRESLEKKKGGTELEERKDNRVGKREKGTAALVVASPAVGGVCCCVASGDEAAMPPCWLKDVMNLQSGAFLPG